MSMSPDGQLACKVLASLPAGKRTYMHLMERLSARFPRDVEQGSTRARAVRAIMEAMDAGIINRMGGELLSEDELKRRMSGG